MSKTIFLKTSKPRLALLLSLILLAVFALPACKPKPEQEQADGDGTPPPAATYADKSGLGHASSLDAYKKTDWTADWIWGDVASQDIYVAFRKTFNLESAPASAKAYIAAESKYFMWVNGVLTVYDGSAKRGPTPYDTFCDEVSFGNLKAGANTLAFLVVYNGRESDSGLNAGEPGFIFESDIGGQKIVSNGTFRAMRLREYKNKSLLKGDYPNYPAPAMLGEWNVYYDARDGIGDFTDPGFDDSAWPKAVRTRKAGAEPFNDLYRNPAPIIGFGGILDFTNAAEHVGKTFAADATVTLSLPENRQFSPYFELEAEGGKKIVYYAGYAGRKPNFVDTYITKPGAQSFENYPWRSGPSLIVEVPAGVKFTRLGYRPSGYPAEITGNFTSDDDGLNQLWREAINSVVINMRDTFMDCPDRERAPYAGDAANQIDILLYGLDSNAYGMIQKTILTEIGWTKTDKILPSRAPSKTPHEIPVQSLAFIVEVYNYYLHTGDADTLNLFYPVAMDYLKLFNLKADNMLETRDGSWMWTDWGNNADVEVIQNAWYYYAVSNMSKLAAALEITADNAFMSARMSALKTGFTAKYKKQDGGFRSGAKDDDRANALAVLGGLADPGDYAALIPILTNTKEASIYMEKFVLEALCVMGEYETAKDRILERYAPMLTDSYTTLWEGWTIDDADFVSLNHGWSGGFLTVMSKYFAGIRPTAEGFSKYEIFPKNLFDSLNCAVDTGDGKITLSVTKNGNGGYTMNIHAVSGEGVLKISSDFGGTVSISGGAYTQNPDGTGYKSYTLSGGDYVVEIS